MYPLTRLRRAGRACRAWLPVTPRRLRRTVSVPVAVGDRSGSDADVLTLVVRFEPHSGPEDGVVVEVLPGGPATDEEFRQAIGTATTWAEGRRGYPRQGRILWTLQSNDATSQLSGVKGGSVGGAFALALAYLFGLTPVAARRPRDPRAVLSAEINPYGLLGPVTLLDQKATAVGRTSGGRLLVAPAAHDRAIAAQHGGRPEVTPVTSMSEAVRAAALRRSLAVPVAFLLVAAAAGTGVWSYRHEQEQHAASVQAQVEKLAGQVTSNLGSAPDISAATALKVRSLDARSDVATAAQLSAAYDDLRLSTVISSPAAVTALDYSPDGELLAVAAGGTATVYAAGSHRARTVVGVGSGTVTEVRFTTDGAGLVVGTDRGEVLLRRLTAAAATLRSRTLQKPSGSPVLALAAGAGGRVAWATATGVDGLASYGAPSSVHLRGPDPAVTSLLFLPSGRLAVGRLTGGEEPALQVYPALRAGGSPTDPPVTLLAATTALSGTRSRVSALAASNGGRVLLAAVNGDIQEWDTSTLKPRKETVHFSNYVYGLSATPDGRTVLAATRSFPPAVPFDTVSAGAEVSAVDTSGTHPAPGLAYREEAGSLSAVVALRPGTGAPAVAVAPLSGSARILQYAPLTRASAHGEVTAVVGDPSAPDSVLVLYLDGRLIRYRPRDHRTTTLLAKGKESGLSTAIAPSGDVLALGDSKGDIRLYELGNRLRQRGQPLFHRASPVFRLAFAPDGNTLAAGTSAGEVQLWNMKTRTAKIVPKPAGAGPVGTLAWQPSGTALLVGYRLGYAQVLDPRTSRVIARRDFGTSGADDGSGDLSAALPYEGGYLAGFGDGRIATYTARLLLRSQLPQRHRGNVLGAALSPDGEELLTVGADFTALLQHVPDSRTLLRVSAPEVPDDSKGFYDGAWSTGDITPDGNWVVLGGTRGRLDSLALRFPSLVQRLCALTDPRTRSAATREACR
ncbi:WD40 repeat domain-containing protein [Streptomyces sp. NPDC001414]